jgi:hypothetical protein
MNINYIGKVQKIAKAYAKGFSAATGSTYTQRQIDVVQMKAEMSQDANEMYLSVMENLQAKGVEWNDLSKASVELKNAVLQPFINGLQSDIFRQFWLNDTYKEKLSNTTYGNYNGVADSDYNAFKGIWQHIFEVASTTPNYDTGGIFRVAISNGAVAQVATVTITGTGGTANINVNGVNYLATFDTDLTTTAANFVTAHSAALALRKITVTSSGAGVILTSSIPGQPFAAPTITNVSSNLAGSVAATTANTAPTSLADDEVLATLDLLHAGCSPVLRNLPSSEKIIYMDFHSYDNYLKTLRSVNSTGAFSIESGKLVLTNGLQLPLYKGIPVVMLDWDAYLNDFPHASGQNPAYNNRIIYTENNNLILAVDSMSEFAMSEFWYNKDEQENRFRVQYKMGANYTHNEMTAVAY